ncbi:MAG: hypothetical protein HY928_11860 [Elusimicrobia bacterium]|nr:hypothetical protein [Elusimicrobiota bacterium]
MKNTCSLGRERGQIMMGAVIVMGVVALIFIAAVVFKNVQTQKASSASQKGISAYEVARAAAEKATWTLNLDNDNWKALSSGTPLTGFDGGTVFTDVPGGKYKVAITSGPTTDDRTVTVWAKDGSASPEYRGLQVVLSKTVAQFGVVMANKIKFQQRTKAHWGPIYAYEELDMKRKARVSYPRLFSKGKIKHIDNKSSLPNTDGVRWWSFNFPPGVPSWPQIDFEYYKSIAQNQGTYYAKGDRSKKKKHSDDKDSDKKDSDEKDNDKDRSGDDEWIFSNIIDTQPYVRYYDTGVKAKFQKGKNLLRGAIIAMDTVEFKDGTASLADVNAKYAASGLAAYYPRTVNIPSTAWREYQKVDTAEAGDYPGDVGGPGKTGMNATYTFGAASADNLQTDAPIHIEGWVYAGEKLKLHRAGTIVGLVMCPSKNVKLENSEEDKDSDRDTDYDQDHRSKYTSDKDTDNDHHDQDSDGVSTHVDHSNDWHQDAHKKRLTFYFQDLDIKTKGSSITQKSWREIPVQAF